MNTKHYLSDVPCGKCKGRIRYRSTGACVPCAKRYTQNRRGTLPAVEQPLITPSQHDGFVYTAGPLRYAMNDSGEDLIGDVVIRPRCPGCGAEIDPDCCHCGVSLNQHNDWNEGHGFVPMNCNCFRATNDDTGDDLL